MQISGYILSECTINLHVINFVIISDSRLCLHNIKCVRIIFHCDCVLPFSLFYMYTHSLQKWQRKFFRLDARGDLYYYDNENVTA